MPPIGRAVWSAFDAKTKPGPSAVDHFTANADGVVIRADQRQQWHFVLDFHHLAWPLTYLDTYENRSRRRLNAMLLFFLVAGLPMAKI